MNFYISLLMIATSAVFATQSKDLDTVVTNMNKECLVHLTSEACDHIFQEMDSAAINELDVDSDTLAQDVADGLNKLQVSKKAEKVGTFIADILDTDATLSVKEQLEQVVLDTNQVERNEDGLLVPTEDQTCLANDKSTSESTVKVFTAICKAMPDTCAYSNALSKRKRDIAYLPLGFATILFGLAGAFLYSAIVTSAKVEVILYTCASMLFSVFAFLEIGLAF